MTEDFSNKRQVSKKTDVVELRRKIVLSDVSNPINYFVHGPRAVPSFFDLHFPKKSLIKTAFCTIIPN